MVTSPKSKGRLRPWPRRSRTFASQPRASRCCRQASQTQAPFAAPWTSRRGGNGIAPGFYRSRCGLARRPGSQLTLRCPVVSCGVAARPSAMRRRTPRERAVGILSDVAIVDLTYGTAGPLALQLLADMGANIVRVDTPADRVREQQGSFVRLRGRRSIYIDPGAPGADEVLRRLIDRSDVVISEPGLDAKPPLPGDFASLSATNPRLIHCRITAYGDEGPLVDGWAHDHLVAARYGVYHQPGWGG